MSKHPILTLFTVTALFLFVTACSVKPHPNEKTIIGTWTPVLVEKMVDSAELQAAAQLTGGASRKTGKDGAAAPEGAAGRKDAALDKLVQAEQRATLEILENHTAIKKFPGKPINATWKMKGNGTKIVAKNIENKMKFTIEILEINKERIVVIEHAPVGDVKIVYERKF